MSKLVGVIHIAIFSNCNAETIISQEITILVNYKIVKMTKIYGNVWLPFFKKCTNKIFINMWFVSIYSG